MYQQDIPKQDYSKIVKVIGANVKPTIANTIINALNIDSTSSILELGCGTGGDARFIKNKTNAEITGVDINKYVIEFAKNHIPILEFDLTLSPYPLNSLIFDGVFCINLLQLIPDKKTLFEEIYRVLKPNGAFFSMITTKEQILNRYINKYFPSLENIELQRHLFQEDLILLLESVGFKNIEVVSIDFDICTINRDYLNRLKSGILSSLLLLNEEDRNNGLKNLEKDICEFEDANSFPKYKRVRSAIVAHKTK